MQTFYACPRLVILYFIFLTYLSALCGYLIPLLILNEGMTDYKPELYPDESFQRNWIHNYLDTWHQLNNLGEVTDEDVEKMFHLVDDFSMVNYHFVFSIIYKTFTVSLLSEQLKLFLFFPSKSKLFSR